MEPDPDAVNVLVLVRDLIFATKITATARDLGVTCRLLRDPAKLAGSAGGWLVVDLNLDGAIDAAAAWRSETPGRTRTVVGFVSHVDAATIARARAAGLDRVMARSQFAQTLPDLLTSMKEPP